MDNLKAIDQMSGYQFEFYTQQLLQKLGYRNVTHTPASNDHGIDCYYTNRDGILVGIQCKHLQQGTVPYRAIEEVLSGSRFYGTTINIVLTNQFFAKKTRETCHQMNFNHPQCPIYLWDRNRLRTLVMRAHLFKKASNNQIEKNLSSSNSHPINQISHRINPNGNYHPIQFKKRIVKLIRSMGLQVEENLSKNSNFDLIGCGKNLTIGYILIYCSLAKDRVPFHYIQLAVHQIQSSVKRHNYDYIITNGLFTQFDQHKFYKQQFHRIRLCDHKNLIRLHKQVNKKF